MLDADTEATIESLYQTGGDIATDRLVNDVLMNGGIPSEDTLIQLAPQFNMSREQLGAVVKSVTEKFYSQAYYTV